MKYRIGIIGGGFVGSACDVNFAALPNTQVHVYDKFKASEAHDTVIENSDILFVCVPTPMREDGGCDTSIVSEAVERINKRARKEKIIVIKSTVPPGTTDRLQTEFERHFLFFNPEFLTQRNFIEDFANQELIVLGESIRGPAQKLTDFYLHFANHQEPPKALIYNTSAATAEMLKYTINCYLAMKVTFFNEIFKICEKTQAHYGVLVDILKRDKRIGKTHMQVPGSDGQFGFSLACFPKDINALIAFAHERGVDASLLEAVWQKNLLVREKHDWTGLAQVNGKYSQAI